MQKISLSLTNNPVLWQQTHIYIQASFGLAKGCEHASLKELLHHADLEMYREKHHRRNSKPANTGGFLPQTG